MFEPKAVVPGELFVAGQPAPDDVRDMANQGYKTLISNRPDNESQDQPSADAVRAAAEGNGVDFIHIPVTLSSVSRRDVDAFRDALANAKTPVVAHCGTGKRAYLLWAAGQVFYQGGSVDELIANAADVGLDAKDLHQVVKQTTEH